MMVSDGWEEHHSGSVQLCSAGVPPVPGEQQEKPFFLLWPGAPAEQQRGNCVPEERSWVKSHLATWAHHWWANKQWDLPGSEVAGGRAVPIILP